MFEVSSTIDSSAFSDVMFTLEALGDNRLPATADAVARSTVMVQERWVHNAMRAFTHSGGSYVRGIMDGAQYPYQGDPYRGAVINTAPNADVVENGSAPYDMKRMLYTSPKARMSKDGKRYMIIPFRHGTPGTKSMAAMPKSIYKQAKSLAVSRRTSARQITNPVTGKKVTRNTYNWGGRLRQSDVEAAGAAKVNMQPHYKSSIYAGMVKMANDTGGSQYMTFRVMHQDSTGWQHPGTAAKKLAENTANEMESEVQAEIEKGFDQDMKTMLRLAG